MNILIPHRWLTDHLETSATPEQIRELVSLAGPTVERIEEVEGDQVYDIEITTNRVDAMSIRGFAREAAVILTHLGHPSRLKPIEEVVSNLSDLKDQLGALTQAELPLPQIKSRSSLNRRTLAIVMDQVELAATPDWMATRLTQVGQNVHDAVIDITNYVTHELGHPCHVFDYDKIMEHGGVLEIVEASAGESFTTLDGLSFTTVGGEVVIKDGRGEIIDLPSIKGTLNTAVSDQTKRVLLFMESIEASKVRFASMTHAIRTTAAQLMEKNLDPNLADDTLHFALTLYQNLCGAKLASPLYDHFPRPVEHQPIALESQEVSRYLGVSLSEQKVTEILSQLSCTVESVDQGSEDGFNLAVTPPTFRGDLAIPADLIEEIARIYGYHNLPSAIMTGPIPTTYPEDFNPSLEHKLKLFLAHLNWQETYNYSMVSQELALESGYHLDEHLKLQNPLTEDRTYLRRSLIPSLAEMIAANPLVRPLRVFELASVYHPTETGQFPDQVIKLSLATTEKLPILKGAVEGLLASVYLSDLEVRELDSPKSPYHQQGSLHSQGSEIGTIAVTKKGLAVAELDLVSLLKIAKRNPAYTPLPKTTPIIEDITITLAEKTQLGPLIETIASLDSLIESVTLKDTYQDNITLTIHYQDPVNNLSSEDVVGVRRKIVSTLQDQYQGQLVGDLKI